MKSILDFELNNKTVILRCDLNVSIKDGKIIDDTRIKASLKTINYILDSNAKLVILSHLGKVKNKQDKEKNDMRIVYERLNELLPNKIHYINKTRGIKVKTAVKKLKNQEALLLQNTRYEDLKGKKESICNKNLSKFWASLGDIYINDAFGTIHRKHASNYGISTYLPSGLGFLVIDELDHLNILDHPKKPFAVIMGGAKVSDKIGIIKELIKKVDYLLIGGAMSFTFLKAQGKEIGNSLYEKEYLKYCEEILDEYQNKIILPVDFTGKTSDKKKQTQDAEKITNDFIGYDIGEKTIKKFKEILKKTNTLFWNGPLGKYEEKEYQIGTKEVLKYAKDNVETVILGGGDIVGCSNLLGYTKDITYASTGGGATLEYIKDHNQPGISGMTK